MNELVGWLAAKAGIDDAIAEKTVGIMLDYLRSEGPPETVQVLIDSIPGAEAAIAAARTGSGLSRLMGGGLMARRHAADGPRARHDRHSENCT